MEERLQTILDSVSPEEPRSRLEPYRELILRLRRDGRTYRRIVAILNDKCGVRVTPSTLHEFVQRRARARKVNPAEMASANPVMEPQITAAASSVPAPQPESQRAPKRLTTEEYAAQVARMKTLREAPAVVPEKKKRFEYNPDEPLTLIKPKKEK